MSPATSVADLWREGRTLPVRVFGRSQRITAAAAQIARAKAQRMPRCLECVRRLLAPDDDTEIRDEMERRLKIRGWL